MDLEQYIGVFRSTHMGGYYREIDWEKHQTRGSYTIVEYVVINRQKVTRGEMNMQVYDNGVLIHNITNGKFEVPGF